MSKELPLRINEDPGLESSVMVVVWTEDAGRLGQGVDDYLRRMVPCTELGEIDPAGFFPLRGVSIEEDVAQFPESRFYVSQETGVVILKSTPPKSGWHRFIDTVVHAATEYCHVSELYSVGSMVYFGAHTTPRQLLVIANCPEMKSVLAPYVPGWGMNFETPPGQRPTISAFLQWAARSRGIRGASLWVPVPFYLAAGEDPRAWRRVMEFLNERLSLGVDLSDLSREIAKQNDEIGELKGQVPEIDDYIRRLESHLHLSPEENEKLVKEVDRFLKRHR